MQTLYWYRIKTFSNDLSFISPALNWKFVGKYCLGLYILILFCFSDRSALMTILPTLERRKKEAMLSQSQVLKQRKMELLSDRQPSRSAHTGKQVCTISRSWSSGCHFPWNQGGSCSTVAERWTVGHQVDRLILHLGHELYGNSTHWPGLSHS